MSVFKMFGFSKGAHTLHLVPTLVQNSLNGYGDIGTNSQGAQTVNYYGAHIFTELPKIGKLARPIVPYHTKSTKGIQNRRCLCVNDKRTAPFGITVVKNGLNACHVAWSAPIQ